MTETKTPVGEKCMYCLDPIEEDDAGVVMPAYTKEGWSVLPAHVECFIRAMLGSPAHLDGRCSCATGKPDDDHTHSNYRDEAREVMKRWNLGGIASTPRKRRR